MSNSFEKEILQPAAVEYLEKLGYTCVCEYLISRKRLDIFATSPNLGVAFVECKISSVSMKSHVKQILGYWNLYRQETQSIDVPKLMLAFPISAKISQKEREICERNNISIIQIGVEIPQVDLFSVRLSANGAKALKVIEAHLKSSVPRGINVSRNDAVSFSLLETAKHIGDKDHDRNH